MRGRDMLVYMLEAREDLKQKRKAQGKGHDWEDNDQSQERQSKEWKTAKELISFAVCKASREYMHMVRTGRSRSGENQQETEERIHREKEARERARQAEQDDAVMEVRSLFDGEEEGSVVEV